MSWKTRASRPEAREERTRSMPCVLHAATYCSLAPITYTGMAHISLEPIQEEAMEEDGDPEMDYLIGPRFGPPLHRHYEWLSWAQIKTRWPGAGHAEVMIEQAPIMEFVSEDYSVVVYEVITSISSGPAYPTGPAPFGPYEPGPISYQ